MQAPIARDNDSTAADATTKSFRNMRSPNLASFSSVSSQPSNFTSRLRS